MLESDKKTAGMASSAKGTASAKTLTGATAGKPDHTRSAVGLSKPTAAASGNTGDGNEFKDLLFNQVPVR